MSAPPAATAPALAQADQWLEAPSLTSEYFPVRDDLSFQDMEHRMQSPQPPSTVLPPCGSQNLQGGYWPGARRLHWEQNGAL